VTMDLSADSGDTLMTKQIAVVMDLCLITPG
jgi:hypothetical protein